MIYVTMQDGMPVGWTKEPDNSVSQICRPDFTSLSQVQDIVAALNELSEQELIATDAGEYVSPRYDLMVKPQVGDEVSMAFNGDYYPVGHITSISGSLKVITTSSGKRFYRKKQSGTWKYNKTWSLVAGLISKRNPHF